MRYPTGRPHYKVGQLIAGTLPIIFIALPSKISVRLRLVGFSLREHPYTTLCDIRSSRHKFKMPPTWLVIVLSCLFGIPTVLVVVPILLAIIVSHWSDIENVVKKLAGKLVTLLRSGVNTLLSHLSDIVAYPVCILLGCAPGYVTRLRRKRWEDKVAKSLRRSSADVEENRETRPELILDVWVPEAALRSRETTANGPTAQARPPVNGITPEAALQMHHTPVQGPNSQASPPVNAIPPETAHRPQESPAGAPISQVRPPVNELPLFMSHHHAACWMNSLRSTSLRTFGRHCQVTRKPSECRKRSVLRRNPGGSHSIRTMSKAESREAKKKSTRTVELMICCGVKNALRDIRRICEVPRRGHRNHSGRAATRAYSAASILGYLI